MIAMASIDIAPAIERVGATNAGDPDAANGYPWQHLTLHVTIVRSDDDLWENAFLRSAPRAHFLTTLHATLIPLRSTHHG